MPDTDHQDTEQIDLRAALGGLRRRILLIVICVVVVAGSALGFSLSQEKQYSAEASLLFRDPGFDQRLFGASSFEGTLDPARDAETNVRLVSLDVVAADTAEEVDGELTRSEVQEKVAIEEQGQSDVVSVIATDPDPDFAAELANSFAQNYIDFRREADQAKVSEARELVEGELEKLDPEEDAEESQSLQDQLSDLKTLEALQTGNAELVQPATAPDEPSSPLTARNTVVGAVLGLLFGIALALLRERLDRRLREAGDLEQAYALPVIGTVPDSKALAAFRTGKGPVDGMPFAEAEAFRMLRSRLRYFNVDRDIRSVVITSAGPGEGKSTVALNLARTAAGAGSRVFLLEADLHQPTLAATLGLAPLPGLAEVLSNQSSFENAIQVADAEGRTNGSSGGRTLDAMVAGATPPNPAGLIESGEMASLVSRLESDYDIVVIDTPPVSVLADAIPLIKLASGVIVVGQLGRTTRDEAAHLREQLRNLDAPMLGVVGNRARSSDHSYGYGYYQAARGGP